VASYSIALKWSAPRELEALSGPERRALIGRIRALSGDPRPAGSERLSGAHRYRVREGRYRILYEVDDREGAITVVRTGGRPDVSP
jgi:mRNA interferase RelE/StbE